MVLVTCVIGVPIFLFISLLNFVSGQWIGGILFLLGAIGFGAGVVAITRQTQRDLDAQPKGQPTGYVKVIDPGSWCVKCPAPIYTNERTKERVGIGSEWVCPACHRHWGLDQHEVVRFGIMVKPSLWVPALAG